MSLTNLHPTLDEKLLCFFYVIIFLISDLPLYFLIPFLTFFSSCDNGWDSGEVSKPSPRDVIILEHGFWSGVEKVGWSGGSIGLLAGSFPPTASSHRPMRQTRGKPTSTNEDC